MIVKEEKVKRNDQRIGETVTIFKPSVEEKIRNEGARH